MTQGLSPTARDRLSGCLERLLPHVKMGRLLGAVSGLVLLLSSLSFSRQRFRLKRVGSGRPPIH